MNEVAIAPRVPPHNLDAELAVLGSVLLEPSTFEYCSHLPREAFYSEKHRYIWDAICKVTARGDRPDTVTLADQLRVNQKLDFVGGAIYIAGLCDTVPTALYAEAYSKIVEERYVLREIIYKADHLTNHAYHAKDLQLVLDEASQLPNGLDLGNSSDQISQSQLSFDLIRQIGSGTAVKAVSTGFNNIDTILGGGLERGKLYILGARPAMGKSALMMQIFHHIAKTQEGQTVVFSLEMDAAQIATRLISSQTNMSIGMIQKAKRGEIHLSDVSKDKIIRVAHELAELPLSYFEKPTMTIPEMGRALRQIKNRDGLAFLCVDYIGLLSVPNVQNPVERMSRITRELKNLARELNIPILALSQLSRALESRPDRHPMMSDLRDSGSVEQDADAIFALYRAGYYYPEKSAVGMGTSSETAELLVLKNRDGQTGTVNLRFTPNSVSFSDAVG